jgi:hypothetical protein
VTVTRLRIVFSEGDFRDLVEGKSVRKWVDRDDDSATDVQIVLEDIGFYAMEKAIHVAQQSREAEHGPNG